VALLEWGLTPEYINRRWTEELLALMFISRTKRLKRHAVAASGEQTTTPYKIVSEQELFAEMKLEPEVVYRAN